MKSNQNQSTAIPFLLLPESYSSYIHSTFNIGQFYRRTCNCKLTKCNSYENPSQILNQDNKSFQLTCWDKLLKIIFVCQSINDQY